MRRNLGEHQFKDEKRGEICKEHPGVNDDKQGSVYYERERERRGTERQQRRRTIASMFVCVERITGVAGTRVRAIVVGARVVTASIERVTFIDVCSAMKRGWCKGGVNIYTIYIYIYTQS